MAKKMFTLAMRKILRAIPNPTASLESLSSIRTTLRPLWQHPNRDCLRNWFCAPERNPMPSASIVATLISKLFPTKTAAGQRHG